METTYWLVALPLEGRLSRGAAGAEQVLKVLNDKTSPDLSTNYKARRWRSPPRPPSHLRAPARSARAAASRCWQRAAAPRREAQRLRRDSR